MDSINEIENYIKRQVGKLTRQQKIAFITTFFIDIEIF